MKVGYISSADYRAQQETAQSENIWQAKVMQAAKYANWLCYHTHDSRQSPSGFPDLVCVRDGRMLALELKREQHRTDKARLAKQLAWLEMLNAIPGVTAMLARPSDWPKVVEALGGE